jgi:DNA polymerase-4
VQARPELYVRTHHRIVEAVESVLPVEAIHSIDEMHCRLLGVEREHDHALDLARRVKQAILTRVGERLTCSVGLAPNRWLAKVASNMQKPDGLTVIHRAELPQRLHALDLTDLPGIAHGMEGRLRTHGITTVAQLCALDQPQMVHVFHSVIGQDWYHWLRGDEIGDQAIHRRSMGHQHILAPELRTETKGRAVAVRLLSKAAMRLRTLDYWATRLTLSIRYVDRRGWGRWVHLTPTQDTLEMLEALAQMWSQRPPGAPKGIRVVLGHLVPARSATLPLFALQQRRGDLARAIDAVNTKYQRHLVYAGSMHEATRSAPVRIAFGSVPDIGREW